MNNFFEQFNMMNQNRAFIPIAPAPSTATSHNNDTQKDFFCTASIIRSSMLEIARVCYSKDDMDKLTESEKSQLKKKVKQAKEVKFPTHASAYILRAATLSNRCFHLLDELNRKDTVKQWHVRILLQGLDVEDAEFRALSLANERKYKLKEINESLRKNTRTVQEINRDSERELNERFQVRQVGELENELQLCKVSYESLTENYRQLQNNFALQDNNNKDLRIEVLKLKEELRQCQADNRLLKESQEAHKNLIKELESQSISGFSEIFNNNSTTSISTPSGNKTHKNLDNHSVSPIQPNDDSNNETKQDSVLENPDKDKTPIQPVNIPEDDEALPIVENGVRAIAEVEIAEVEHQIEPEEADVVGIVDDIEEQIFLFGEAMTKEDDEQPVHFNVTLNEEEVNNDPVPVNDDPVPVNSVPVIRKVNEKKKKEIHRAPEEKKQKKDNGNPRTAKRKIDLSNKNNKKAKKDEAEAEAESNRNFIADIAQGDYVCVGWKEYTSPFIGIFNKKENDDYYAQFLVKKAGETGYRTGEKTECFEENQIICSKPIVNLTRRGKLEIVNLEILAKAFKKWKNNLN